MFRRQCAPFLTLCVHVLVITGTSADDGSKNEWKGRSPGSGMTIGSLTLTGMPDSTSLNAVSTVAKILSRYTLVSAMDIPKGYTPKLLSKLNGAGDGVAFSAKEIRAPTKSSCKRGSGIYYRTDYIELEDASYYGKSNGELDTPALISVFKLKNKDQKSPLIVFVSIMSGQTITKDQMTKIVTHARSKGEEILIGGEFQVQLPKQPLRGSQKDIMWWDGLQYQGIRTLDDCPGCIWACQSCATRGYPMEGRAGDETAGSGCPYCREFTWLIESAQEKMISPSKCSNCKMIMKGSWLRQHVSPGAGRVWRYDQEHSFKTENFSSFNIKHPVEVTVSMGALEESSAECTLEDPAHDDRDPASQSKNTNNLLVGFFAFTSPSGSALPSDTAKELLKKVIERSDIMMVLNMPKTLEMFPPGYQRGRKRRATIGTIETTSALFYDERIITVDKFQQIRNENFPRCPPAAALIRHTQYPDQPPIGLLMLYGTKKLIKGIALAAVYARAKEILKTENIIIAGELNTEQPEVPELKPFRIPWYDGSGQSYLATPDQSFCPWFCPCKRFKYMVSVSGECSAGHGKEPYTKDFMWLQKTGEKDCIGGGGSGFCSESYGKMVIGGTWLQNILYAGTGRVHMLDVAYELQPEELAALQVTCPVEIVLKLEGSRPDTTTRLPPTTTTIGSGNSSANNYMMHLSAALGGTMCKRLKTMELGAIKGKHPHIPSTPCWYGRKCSDPSSCEKFSKHSCGN